MLNIKDLQVCLDEALIVINSLRCSVVTRRPPAELYRIKLSLNYISEIEVRHIKRHRTATGKPVVIYPVLSVDLYSVELTQAACIYPTRLTNND